MKKIVFCEMLFCFGFFLFNFDAQALFARPIDTTGKLQLVEVVDDTKFDLSYIKTKAYELIDNKLHPTKDPANLIFFQLSLINQVKLLGAKRVSMEHEKEIRSIFHENDKDEFALSYLSDEAEEKYKVPLVSTPEGVWIHRRMWVEMEEGKRREIIARHAVVPHRRNIFKNSAEIFAESAGIGLGILGAKRLTTYVASKQARLNVLVAVVGIGSILHRTGVSKEVIKNLSYYNNDGSMKLSLSDAHEIEKNADTLLNKLSGS